MLMLALASMLVLEGLCGFLLYRFLVCSLARTKMGFCREMASYGLLGIAMLAFHTDIALTITTGFLSLPVAI